MKLIIDFYQGLDALNTIIFWGIIIVILLLIVFSILMINKKRNQKHHLNDKTYQDELYSDEIALPSNSRDTLIMKDENLLIQEEQHQKFEPFIIPNESNKSETIEVEKKFKAEDHVMEYNNELFNLSNVKKNSEIPQEEKTKNDIKETQPFKMPTKPYERNVLREMSLSQTSPIGIVKKEDQISKNPRPIVEEPVKSFGNQDNINNLPPIEKSSQDHIKEEISKEEKTIKEPVTPIYQKETQSIINHVDKSFNQNINPKHEVTNSIETQPNSSLNNHYSQVKTTTHNGTESIKNHYANINNIPASLEKTSPPASIVDIPKTKQTNAQFLEEVSQKLAAADVSDEIERTDYELQQEEDAIISYKELMEKKDTIKTIDEEDAVISIKELTKRKEQEEKLYNLTENEENNEFIDELKKFRNDLN